MIRKNSAPCTVNYMCPKRELLLLIDKNPEPGYSDAECIAHACRACPRFSCVSFVPYLLWHRCFPHSSRAVVAPKARPHMRLTRQTECELEEKWRSCLALFPPLLHEENDSPKLLFDLVFQFQY